MSDAIILSAAKVAAIHAMNRAYNPQFNHFNHQRIDSTVGTYVYRGVIFDSRTGEPLRKAADTPQADRTWADHHGNGVKVAKSARPLSVAEADRRYRAEQRANRAEVVKTLRDQAADWRQRALDGRINGLDPEVRALYVRKADQADAEATALEKGTLSEADRSRAVAMELEATRLEGKARGHEHTVTGQRHVERARELRDRAANVRAGRPDDYRPDTGREVSFSLPR